MRSLICGRGVAILAGFCIIATSTAFSQDSLGPQPVPLPPPVIAPADTPYPGTINLRVDLTDPAPGVIRVHEMVPVAPGALTLLYPEWLPGEHGPNGPISKVAGLVVAANGKRIPWVRDRVNMFAFHIDVPTNTNAINVDFQYLTAVRKGTARISFSSKMIDLSWNSVVLYPAGHFSRRIVFAPSVQLPQGWHYASALEVASQRGGLVRFKNTPLNTLIDSPLYAGVNYKRIDLSPTPDNRVYLDIFADEPSDLAITPEQIQLHRNLVNEAAKLFDSRHYDHYDFLFTISDVVGGNGLEHHQSSEDGTRANYFTDWAAGVRRRELLPHEYTHSWNGKFRRPADLWTPNFNVPMQDDLLWVYEGLTEYYAAVLTARSGLCTPQQTRDMMAEIAAGYAISPARTWDPLIDTTNVPIMSQRTPAPYVGWTRSADYYQESLLIWLDVDTKIRATSDGKKSLDDFAKLFYGIDNGSIITHTYTFADLVAALNKVQQFDWASFLRARVYKLSPQVPTGGFTRGGYRLAYTDTEPAWWKPVEAAYPVHADNFSTSIGVVAGPHGALLNVWWGSTAFRAGLYPGMQFIGVNGNAYTAARLRTAIIQAEKSTTPIHLLAKREDRIVSVDLNYHGGLRYPSLERIDGTPDRLDAILAPRR
ncbi:MAG: peptidase M61 [Acidobacteriaceae bacterium]